MGEELHSYTIAVTQVVFIFQKYQPPAQEDK